MRAFQLSLSVLASSGPRLKPDTFTLDACRHGGMTELEEAELTDGQGRALSGHRIQRAYEGYAKRTLARALPATRKRYAHALATFRVQPFSEPRPCKTSAARQARGPTIRPTALRPLSVSRRSA
jgi:hypothetical protein